MKKNKQLKLIAKTASERIGSILFSVLLIGTIVALIVLGYLNFADKIVLTISSMVAALVIIIPMLASNFGSYVLFDLEKGLITLNQNGFKKSSYCLEAISKLQVEEKTLDLHVAADIDEHQLKNGSACIKQTSYKKVHFRMSSHRSEDQRIRYEEFAAQCNKILNEVVHKKIIKQVHRLVDMSK